MQLFEETEDLKQFKKDMRIFKRIFKKNPFKIISSCLIIYAFWVLAITS